MRTWIFIASVVLAGLVLLAWHEVDWAIDTRATHAPMPDELVQYQNQMMSQEAFMLTVLFPRDRVGTVRFALLKRRNLYPVLYIIAGLAGACASLWLLLIKSGATNTATNWDRVAASVLLAAVAGLIAYLLVQFSNLAIKVDDRNRLYADALVFPVLAGLFNTVFYDALPGLLTAILDRLKKLAGSTPVVMVLCVVVSGVPETHAQQAAVSTSSSYYKCVDPPKLPCRAFNDEDKAACASCKQWQTVPISLAVAAFIEGITASYENKAGAFLGEAASGLHNVQLSTDGVSAKAVYANPERFGLKEVPAAGAVPGTLVAFPNLAGVVANTRGDVAYPSARLDGQINVTAPRNLSGEGAARYLVPVQETAR